MIDDLSGQDNRPAIPARRLRVGVTCRVGGSRLRNLVTSIAGSFYDARAGSHDQEVSDLLTKHPITEPLPRRTVRQRTRARACRG
jgi:hypothetical protein